MCEAGVITPAQAMRPKDRAPGTAEPPTSHWARHTTATVLMELGVEPKIIGEIIGHGTERVTRGYQHVSSDAARAALESMGARFRLALDAAD
ncbi:tyrosine-type recombinase/integrase [Microbacterium oleivorans]